MTRLLAHSEQSLVAHLNGVAALARKFGVAFGGTDDARVAGWLHDIGKARENFQERIHGEKRKRKSEKEPHAQKEPHAHQGAAVALARQLWPVAFAINAHHAGLHNRSDLQQVGEKYADDGKRCLTAIADAEKVENPNMPFVFSAMADGSAVVDGCVFPPLPAWLDALPFATAAGRQTKMLAVEFYTRMLFSALVDADRLDTENANTTAAGAQTNALKRKGWRFGEKGLAEKGAAQTLLATLRDAIKKRADEAREKGANSELLKIRNEVLEKCESAAAKPRGSFTLTVPTGGGKTLASLAFALNHIKFQNENLSPEKQPLRRVIIVIPYLNIIQQTTKVLRDIFENGTETKLVLEHHSQATDPKIKTSKDDKDEDGWNKERSQRQLAAENWDAPIIVTTSVQFFDSLFSRRPADARKLHNICQSVIIFDEVQTLPPSLLQPILDALKELASHERPYGCSLLLCTATQPALTKADSFEFGFENVTPVIDDVTANELFKKLKRVRYEGINKTEPPPVKDFPTLAKEMSTVPTKQALAILNTRKQARELFDEVKKIEPDSTFHLSTWMYPAHRLRVLAEVERRLAAGKSCFLVATQCVEAGVDVDFPEVWRAFGPYDSIVQAAGRCNRNGALKEGTVHIFAPNDVKNPQGFYESAIKNTELLRRLGKAEPEKPESFETYFRLLYEVTVPDKGCCAIQSEREKLHFEEVSKRFNFIEADTVPLLVEHAKMPDGKTVGQWRKEEKRGIFFTADDWREIQPYIINLSFPASKKTRKFFNKTNSELVFKDDDPIRGLRRLHITNIYADGVNGAGLDLECAALNEIIDSL
ncbi:MAG: CRISPR-associated helicase Cas3' [Puniceicoccales bacterium]|jgi:CRISPR-associated endonuclease/helicase Cas3|nr:CRISPR-associated helicase Cas3' [Puniceicoccales bacterium]